MKYEIIIAREADNSLGYCPDNIIFKGEFTTNCHQHALRLGMAIEDALYNYDLITGDLACKSFVHKCIVP